MQTYVKVLLAILILVSVTVVYGSLNIYLKYKPSFDWWTRNGGKKYNKLFSLFHIYASFESRIYYNLSRWRQVPIYDLTLDMIFFLMYDLMPYKSYIDSQGSARGCLTPRAMCESILPMYGQGDFAYDAWYEKNQDTYDENIALVYTKQGGVGEINDGDYSRVGDEKTGKVGVYPSIYDTSAWQKLILEWLNTSGNTKDIKWKMETGAADKIPHFLPMPDKTDLYKYWYLGYIADPTKDDNVPRPDNFLARMNINASSPLMTYFIGNQYTANYTIVDAVAFNRLLGSTPGKLGGWVGYMIGKGRNVSANELSNYIRTSSEFDPIPPNTPGDCSNGKKAYSGISGFMGGALGIGAMSPLAVEAGVLGPAFWPIIALAVVAGGFGAADGVQNCAP